MAPVMGSASFSAATSLACAARSNAEFLMDDATPPRRMVEGCSVKEISLARGGSSSGDGVERRYARPTGIYDTVSTS
jgi:hypothetical protein